jgi:hypothetical protein
MGQPPYGGLSLFWGGAASSSGHALQDTMLAAWRGLPGFEEARLL